MTMFNLLFTTVLLADIDECASNPCHNCGMCTDLINGYTCNCTDTGFTGYNCKSSAT